MCDRIHYDELDERVTHLEGEVEQLRSESRSGFEKVMQAVGNLAQGFETRMNIFDKRIVEEKEKWGTTLRDVVKSTVRAILALALTAGGITVTRMIINWTQGN